MARSAIAAGIPAPASPSALLRFTRALNVYRRILLGDPLRVLLVALLIGVALAIASLYLKIGLFSVDLELLTRDATPRRQISLNLGYLTQLNYGPWYLLGCPLVLYAIAMASHLTRATGPTNIRSHAALSVLASHAVYQVLGIALLAAFVYKNIEAEYRDINTLGLGWVQAERISDWAARVADRGPVDISSYRFFYMDIPRDGRDDELERILPRAVTVTAVYPPHLRIPNHAAFLAFVGITKAWVGFWEGCVVYASLLALTWTLLVLKSITAADVLALTDEKGAIWAETPALWFLVLGCLTNIFLIARFCANAAKGSFGLPDQYASLAVALPGVAAATLGFGLFHRAFILSPGARVYLISKKVFALFAFWALTLVTLLLVLLKYNDPKVYLPLHSVLCSLPLKVCPIAP